MFSLRRTQYGKIFSCDIITRDDVQVVPRICFPHMQALTLPQCRRSVWYRPGETICKARVMNTGLNVLDSRSLNLGGQIYVMSLESFAVTVASCEIETRQCLAL